MCLLSYVMFSLGTFMSNAPYILEAFTRSTYLYCLFYSQVVMYESDPRSNDSYLCDSGSKAWKKFGPLWDLNSWPLWCWCSAFNYQLSANKPTGSWFEISVFYIDNVPFFTIKIVLLIANISVYQHRKVSCTNSLIFQWFGACVHMSGVH